MSRGVQVFRQTDVTKAIRGAQNAGLDVQRFEIDKTGKIIVITRSADAAMTSEAAEANEWDNV